MYGYRSPAGTWSFANTGAIDNIGQDETDIAIDSQGTLHILFFYRLFGAGALYHTECTP